MTDSFVHRNVAFARGQLERARRCVVVSFFFLRLLIFMRARRYGYVKFFAFFQTVLFLLLERRPHVGPLVFFLTLRFLQSHAEIERRAPVFERDAEQNLLPAGVIAELQHEIPRGVRAGVHGPVFDGTRGEGHRARRTEQDDETDGPALDHLERTLPHLVAPFGTAPARGGKGRNAEDVHVWDGHAHVLDDDVGLVRQEVTARISFV